MKKKKTKIARRKVDHVQGKKYKNNNSEKLKEKEARKQQQPPWQPQENIYKPNLLKSQ